MNETQLSKPGYLWRGFKRVATLLALAAAASGALVGQAGAQTAANGPKELRIGYQKYGTLVILKARGTLEKRLESIRCGSRRPDAAGFVELNDESDE